MLAIFALDTIRERRNTFERIEEKLREKNIGYEVKYLGCSMYLIHIGNGISIKITDVDYEKIRGYRPDYYLSSTDYVNRYFIYVPNCKEISNLNDFINCVEKEYYKERINMPPKSFSKGTGKIIWEGRELTISTESIEITPLGIYEISKVTIEGYLINNERRNYFAEGRYMIKSPEIKKVIFNGPATIVFWSDGVKTVVKQQEGDDFDKEKGLALAISKRFMGTNKSHSNFNDIFKKWCE